MLKLNAKGKRVLIIPDCHVPYHHPRMKEFLSEVKKLHKPDIVIHLGDEVDNHAISFHDSSVELFSAGAELEKAIEYLQSDLHSLFPKMYILESNHGSLLYRKLKHHGIPIAALKPLDKIYGTPRWGWHREIILETKLGPIYLCHGKSSLPGKLALAMGMSTIQGHFHGLFRLNWFKFADNRQIFDCISGCLIDPKSEAFAYGSNHIPKPILGCTIIHANGLPELIPLLEK